MLTVLLIIALILAILAMLNVPNQTKLLGASVICVIIGLLLPSARSLL